MPGISPRVTRTCVCWTTWSTAPSMHRCGLPKPPVRWWGVTLTFAGQQYSEIALENELEFRMLAVDPAVQGIGVGRAVVCQVIEHAQSLPAITAISFTCATFMERAHALYESLGFQRVPSRDWHVPGADVLLWVVRLER